MKNGCPIDLNNCWNGKKSCRHFYWTMDYDDKYCWRVVGCDWLKISQKANKKVAKEIYKLENEKTKTKNN